MTATPGVADGLSGVNGLSSCATCVHGEVALDRSCMEERLSEVDVDVDVDLDSVLKKRGLEIM